MKKSIFNSCIQICILFLFTFSAQASECSYFKQKFLNELTFNESDISIFRSKIEKEDNLCLKNLMGIMLYKGIYFEKDQSRAEKIFYDLSNREYPESTLNFAMLMSQRLDQNPEDVLVLLLGIYKKYARDKENSHLASKARDSARNYVERLSDLSQKCSDNQNSFCSNELLNITSEDIQNLSNSFETALINLQAEVAVKSINETNEARQRVDNIMSILSIGLMAYNIASLSNSQSFNNFRGNTPSGPDPWFKWGQGFNNNLNLYQFKL